MEEIIVIKGESYHLNFLNCYQSYSGLAGSDSEYNCIEACKYIFNLDPVDVDNLVGLDAGFCESCSDLVRSTYDSLLAFNNATNINSYLYGIVNSSIEGMNEETEMDMTENNFKVEFVTQEQDEVADYKIREEELPRSAAESSYASASSSSIKNPPGSRMSTRVRNSTTNEEIVPTDELLGQNTTPKLHGRPGGRRRRPHFSYAQLILQALLSSPVRVQRMYDIYGYIEEKYPYYARHSPSKKWQNCIRNMLSKTAIFVKIPLKSFQGSGAGSYWSIDSALDVNKLYNIAFGPPEGLTVQSIKKCQLSNRNGKMSVQDMSAILISTVTSRSPLPRKTAALCHKTSTRSATALSVSTSEVADVVSTALLPQFLNTYSGSSSNQEESSIDKLEESVVKPSTSICSHPVSNKICQDSQAYFSGNSGQPRLENGRLSSKIALTTSADEHLQSSVYERGRTCKAYHNKFRLQQRGKC